MKNPLPLWLLTVGLLATSPAQALLPLVQNPAQPSAGNRVITLEELWRIGGPDDEENLLGVVDKALADEAGNVYLLDIQLTEVQVFSPEGIYLRSLGRAGDGPGEIRRVSDMVFLPDGTLGLVQAFPGKIVKVDLEGVPAGEMRPGGNHPEDGGFFALRGAASLGTRLVLSGARITRDEEKRIATQFIASFDENSTQLATYFESTTVRAFRRAARKEGEDFFPHDGGWALAPDGRVFVAPQRNGYRLEVFSPEGQPERAFSRPYSPRQRTAAEMEQVRQSMFPRRGRNRTPPDIVVERTERDILDMRVAKDGTLWVLPSRGIIDQPEGIHSTWDLFDSRGNFVETVSLACEGRGQRDAVFFAGSDLVILVKEHAQAMTAFRGLGGEEENSELEAAPLEIVCYRWHP